MKVRDAIALQRQHGFSGLPVIEAGKLVGIVTNRDLRFENRLDVPLRDIMTPQERLITMKEGATLDEAQALMHKHRLERVLIVNDAFQLRGQIGRASCRARVSQDVLISVVAVSVNKKKNTTRSKSSRKPTQVTTH